ncbi:MAG: DUF418 domain-containing protein [Planctomycetia bacterium]|nr:DUF418 domain-containing protein [Planctomycetia bacterium]
MDTHGIVAVAPLPPVPTAPAERLPALDLLRGIAILAILPANMPIWNGNLNMLTMEARPASVLDHAVMAFSLFFIFGKFITLLSILFGAGLAIQADKGLQPGDAYFKRPFTFYYLRRQALLFAIGLFHFLFLWFGDILTSYAIVAVLAYCVAWFSQRNLWWFIGGSLVIVIGWLMLSAASLALGGGGGAVALPPPPPNRPENQVEQVIRSLAHYASTEGQTEIFRDGHLGQMVLFRAAYLLLYLFSFWFALVWYILPCFLIGVWLQRHGIFRDFEQHRPFLRNMILTGLVVGTPLQLGAVVSYLIHPAGSLHILMLYSIAALPFSLAYLGLGLYWSHGGWLPAVQRIFQDVGRMALSNYLLQSVLCNILFYRYGFRLYGQIGHATGFLIVLALTVIQIGVSVAWLRWFRMGPVEWLWRSLADFRMQPLLRRAV